MFELRRKLWRVRLKAEPHTEDGGMREIVVDSFAGGGGASLGITWATGRHPDIAINHDPAAIEMHTANHPRTKHYREDVFQVSPRQVTRGRPVGLLWASPDCKHFSRAKGSKPVSKNIRGLAWVVVKWAAEVAPRVIILENVREFQDWGPLVPAWRCKGCRWVGTEGQAKLVRRRRACPRCDSTRLAETDEKLPDPARKGLTFKQFVGRLKAKGCAVEWRVLNAADYGAPTHRRRLFLVARNDGEPVVWPEPTHGDPKTIGADLFSADLKPWRTAAECIDWSIPCPSIFLTADEAKAWGKANGAKAPRRPLKENTLKRIARGIVRYVLNNPKPFIVDMHRDNRERGADEPAGTVTTQGNRFNLVTPVIAPVTHAGDRRCHEPGEPLPTVTGANRGEMALIAPTLVRHFGKSDAAAVDAPLGTITAGGKGKSVLIAPVLTSLAHGGAADGRDRGLRAGAADAPAGTIHAGGGSFALIAPTLVQTGYGEAPGQKPRALDIEAPLGTAVAGGQKHALVSAFLAKHYGGVVGHDPDRPIGTVTAVDHHSVVAANLVHLNHGEKTASGADEPQRTVTASGNHAALVYSFLTKYYRTATGQPPTDPLHTVTTDDRFGVVTVTVEGQPYVITDIGMRMLKPRELARCQSFPDNYVLTGSGEEQVGRIGNSVPPVVARAVAAANFTPRSVRGGRQAEVAAR